MVPCRPHFLVFRLPPGTVFSIYRTKEACQSLVEAKHRKEHCSTLLVSEGKSGTNEVTKWRNEGEGLKVGQNKGDTRPQRLVSLQNQHF